MKDNEPFEGIGVEYKFNPMTVASIKEVSEGKYKSPEKYYYSNGAIKKIVYLENEHSYPFKEIYFSPEGKVIDTLYLKEGSPQRGPQIDFFIQTNLHFPTRLSELNITAMVKKMDLLKCTTLMVNYISKPVTRMVGSMAIWLHTIRSVIKNMS